MRNVLFIAISRYSPPVAAGRDAVVAVRDATDIFLFYRHGDRRVFLRNGRRASHPPGDRSGLPWLSCKSRLTGGCGTTTLHRSGVRKLKRILQAKSRLLLALWSSPADLTDKILADEPVTALYDTAASSISRDYEAIRINRSLYTVLADVVVSTARSGDALSPESLAALNAEPRIWQLDSGPAGKRLEIPTGFEQSIPGIMVMFTLLVLLTSGASKLTIERKQGLLRRLAATPISRTELIAGKWGGANGPGGAAGGYCGFGGYAGCSACTGGRIRPW